MCSKHVHSTVTRANRFHCLIGVINKPTTFELFEVSSVSRCGNFTWGVKFKTGQLTQNTPLSGEIFLSAEWDLLL